MKYLWLAYYEDFQVASKHPAAHLGEHLGWGTKVRACDIFEQP